MPKKILEEKQISAKLELNVWELDALEDLFDHYLNGRKAEGIDRSAIVSIQARLEKILELIHEKWKIGERSDKHIM